VPALARPESLLPGATDSLLRPASLKPAVQESRDPAAVSAANVAEPSSGQRTTVEMSPQAATAVGAITSRGTPEVGPAAEAGSEVPASPLVAVAPRAADGGEHAPPAMYQ